MGDAGSGERGGDTAGEGKFLVGLTGTMFTNMTFTNTGNKFINHSVDSLILTRAKH